jgi:hypothetical protein
MLTQQVLRKIKESVWIRDEEKCYELGLNTVDYPYQIFESIFVNISASVGKQWKDLYNCKSHHNFETFSHLCISAILIDKWLKKRFKMTPEERVHLLGARLAQIVMFYKNSLD